jgi:hypothetical protein
MNEKTPTLCEALMGGIRHEVVPRRVLQDLRSNGLVEDRGSLGRFWFLTEKGKARLKSETGR